MARGSTNRSGFAGTRGRKRLVLGVCATLLVAGAMVLAPKLLLAYRSVEYVLGYANDVPGGPYKITFGTDHSDELRGGPGNDLLASEGPWGGLPEDVRPDRLDGGMGDDFLDSVSPQYLEDIPADVVRCGPGEDRAVADPQDDVGDDCEKVRRVALGLVPEIGDPIADFPPETLARQYGPNPQPVRSPD